MIFVYYPKCTTCIKAKKWLDDNKIQYVARHISENNPSYEELFEWLKNSNLPIKKFFNTSGLKYRELKLKDRMCELSEDDLLMLLAKDGMLVKRPLIIDGNSVIVGFNETEWKEKLLKT